MSTKINPETTKKMDLNIRDVPVDLQRRFKSQCYREGVSMREKILELMRAVAATPPRPRVGG